jgi:hypothetical protein
VIRPVVITIDVLAVRGLNAAQARALGSALERELTRLVTAHGLADRAASAEPVPSVAIRGVDVRADLPDRAGGAVARAIYEGLAR